jgi:hypothetical protein
MATMNQNRFKRIALYASAGMFSVFLVIGLLLGAELRRTEAETGAVLSAFFSQQVLRDMYQWGAGNAVEIAVQRNPDCRMCPGPGSGIEEQSWFAQSLKSRRSFLSGAWFAQSSRTTRASFFLNSIFSTDISTDLRLPAGARAFFLSPSDLRTKRNDLGFFVVSRVGLSLNKNEALFYVDHFCPGLCGGGGYVLMRKVNGEWQVVYRQATWVS